MPTWPEKLLYVHVQYVPKFRAYSAPKIVELRLTTLKNPPERKSSGERKLGGALLLEKGANIGAALSAGHRATGRKTALTASNFSGRGTAIREGCKHRGCCKQRGYSTLDCSTVCTVRGRGAADKERYKSEGD